MNKKLKTLGYIFLLPTLVLLFFLTKTVILFVELGHQKTIAKAKFYDSRSKYEVAVSSPDITKNARTDLRIEMKELEHNYKLLKYDKKLQFVYIKLYSVLLFFIGMILYRSRGA